jgi:hypothetical protein
VGLEAALVVGVELGCEGRQEHPPSDRREGVLEALAVAAGVVHVVGRHSGELEVAGEAVKVVDEHVVVGAQVVLELDAEPAGEQGLEAACRA